MRSVFTFGELGAGSSRGQEVILVANDTALYLLLVSVGHSEEVRVDGNAGSATVGRSRASREFGGNRVGSASALGFAIDRNDTDSTLFRVEAVILIDDDRVDNGGRAVSSGAGNDSAGSGEASSVEVENRVADGFTVSGQFTGSELGEVVRRATAVSLDFTVSESDSSYSDETIDGRSSGTGAVGEN